MSGTNSAVSNGVADHVARAEIGAQGKQIGRLEHRQERVEDEVSGIQRYLAEIRPTIASLRKIAFVGTVGILGVLGAEVWRLILARP